MGEGIFTVAFLHVVSPTLLFFVHLEGRVFEMKSRRGKIFASHVEKDTSYLKR